MTITIVPVRYITRKGTKPTKKSPGKPDEYGWRSTYRIDLVRIGCGHSDRTSTFETYAEAARHQQWMAVNTFCLVCAEAARLPWQRDLLRSRSERDMEDS